MYYAMESIPTEIFYKIVKHFNVREVSALALASKRMYALYLAFRKITVRAGDSYLYARQIKSINYIKNSIGKGNTRIVLNAYMSFGKTLVGLETAREMLKIYPNKCALIIVPSTVLMVWASEAAKHYPEYRARGLVKNRKILFMCSQFASHNDHIYTVIGQNRADQLGGKIIVTTAPSATSLVPLQNVSIIIVDEYHRNIANTERQLNRDEIIGKIPILMMGASIVNCPDEHVSLQKLSLYNVILPKTHLDIETTFDLNAIKNKIIAADAKHICVALKSQYEVDYFMRQVDGVGKIIYDYKTRSTKKYNTFAHTGGILLTTVKCITEGNNINHCNLFVIQCSDDSYLSLKRTQQLVGRVIRQSAIYNNIDIIFYAHSPIMQARAIMSTVPCSGYEIRAGCLKRSLRHIADKWRTMTHGELLLVLCEPSGADNPFFEGNICAETMTEAELHKIILF